MSEFVIAEKSDLTNIAEAIRSKSGITDKLLLSDLPTLIGDIQGGGRRSRTRFA